MFITLSYYTWSPEHHSYLLAAHSISDGKWSGELHHQGFTEQNGDLCEEDAGAVAQSLPQSWRAGDAIGSVRTPAGLPTSMAEFNNRRTVTIERTRAYSMRQFYFRLRYQVYLRLTFILIVDKLLRTSVVSCSRHASTPRSSAACDCGSISRSQSITY